MNQPDATGVIVNDVTRLNPVRVWAVATPTTIEQVQDALGRFQGPISVGGGHFSMGGQTASPDSLHLDMRGLNRVLEFRPQQHTIRVQAGIRWCDIQRFVDPHDLSVRIMQTYANFTVGGSLSVNVHGRYVGLGPLILSVRAIRLVMADGKVVDATPSQNAELFYGAIGGYGSLGVIVEAELDLTENGRVKRDDVVMGTKRYAGWFRENVRNDTDAVFHNADLYPPNYDCARAVTWRRTLDAPTVPHRLQPLRRHFPLHRYFFWTFTESLGGKWRRKHLLDPLLYFSKPVHWRNYEAGYDVAELEPSSRRHRTYVLQEYFVPVARFDAFVSKMSEILRRHRVNAVNVSVRHALADPGSLLAWARGESFAFVLYHKQRTRANARERVAVWTREMIDAVIECGGTYYLPYQPHATPEQFHRAYPRALELFALKRRFDPQFRWRNVLWDKYYAPTLDSTMDEMAHTTTANAGSDFLCVYGNARGNDDFYRFLQNVYRLYPEDRFHGLIREATQVHAGNDQAVYRELQAKLPSIKPFLSELTYALPSLGKQKREMRRQTLELLGKRRGFDGYLEIGTTGRYLSDLRKHLDLRGDSVLVNDVAPSNSPVDIVERGGVRKLGRFVPLDDYAPLAAAIPDGSIELLTCYIGLHHVPLERLDAFIASLRRVMRPGGILVLRDHDVGDAYMHALASLAHTVFNAGLGVPWETNAKELRHFRTVSEWIEILGRHGFRQCGAQLLQDHDPTLNTLLAFEKA